MDNNWFKIWPSKLLSLMSSLPTGQMRAHMTLLVTIYLSDGGLPDDDEALAFRASLPIEDIQALRPYFRFLGRCEGGRLYLDFAEDVIMERLEFAEKKANAANKRWGESKAKHTKPEESSAQTKKAVHSTAKRRNAVHSTAMPYKHTDIQTVSESTIVLSGAHAPEKPVSPEKPPPENENQSDRKSDPLFVEFCAQFTSAHDGEPYAYKPADFVKLADLRKRYAKAKPQPWEITSERFRRAAGNYFLSEIAMHTLADLCERFSAFFQHPLDQFKNPIRSANGKTALGKTGNDADRGSPKKTTDSDGIRDCPVL